MSIDPMATKYASMSGYHYSGNNPVMINDPTRADYTSWEDEYRAKNYRGGCNCYESPQGGGDGMSPEEFVDWALHNTKYGGHWDQGGQYAFASAQQAFDAGVDYNNYHNAWEIPITEVNGIT